MDPTPSHAMSSKHTPSARHHRLRKDGYRMETWARVSQSVGLAAAASATVRKMAYFGLCHRPARQQPGLMGYCADPVVI